MAKLYAKLFQHGNFKGQYRWISSDEDVDNIGRYLSFNDVISSLIIYRGNDYHPGDRFEFFKHTSFKENLISLGPGSYASIKGNDQISSVSLFSLHNRKADPWISQKDVGLLPSLEVPLKVRVYQHANFGGQYRDLFGSVSNLGEIGFNDAISSIKIYRADGYIKGSGISLYRHANFKGLLNKKPLEPQEISNISKYGWNDAISSIKFHGKFEHGIMFGPFGASSTQQQ